MPSNKNFRIAMLLSEYALKSKIVHKHCCAIVKGGKILNYSINSGYVHAEEQLVQCRGKQRLL